MSTYRKSLAKIDSAITEHIKQNKDEASIVTGWVVVASVSHPESADRDGYIVQASLSLPHHTQVGLLNMALDDKKNLSMLSTIRAMMGDQ